MTPCRVVIADDHPLFLYGLRLVLETSSQFEVVAEAGDGHGVLEILAHNQADIAVLDISMPNMDGTATAKAI
ncbi:MAG: response regulator, partial [Bacteroidota bacterium]